jgi:hypothetical protein
VSPRLIAELGAVVLLTIAFLWYRHSLIAEGEGITKAADAREVAAQLAGMKKQKVIDDKRVKDATDAYTIEHAALVAARAAQPVSHLVCRRPAGSSSVPSATSVRAPDASGAGALPQPGEGDHGATFDPGPELDALHDEADDIVAACRRLNDAVPHSP